jgi:hypothetical protein
MVMMSLGALSSIVIGVTDRGTHRVMTSTLSRPVW